MSQEKLRAAILEMSESDEWYEAREEWTLKTIWFSEDPETCLCGHYPIIEICVIENRCNGNETEVGNHCVKQFMGINSELVFASARKVVKDIAASFNEDAIDLAHRQRIITDWERKFYLNIWRKHELSPKQAQIK